MANQHEIGLTYNWMDRFFPRIFGDTADISCAFYDGDYSKSIQQAQRDKHDWVLHNLAFQPNFRILDIGCGWGNMLEAVRQRGGHGVGVTLSSAQAHSCCEKGLDVQLCDWRDLEVDQLGRFDGVVCIGAFEHFCSIDEYLAGGQEEVYRRFFSLCHRVLKRGKRLYLQTMTWGQSIPDPQQDADPGASEGTNGRLYARLRIFYPGSWLPSGKNQIARVASALFSLVDWNNGREDYIQTLGEWQRGIRRFIRNPANWPRIFSLLVRHAWNDKQFIHRPVSLLYEDQKEVFRRRLFDHYRMFFEKR